MRKPSILALVIVASLGVTGCIRKPLAERGFWSFDSFPSAAVRDRYGFQPDQAWLDRVRLASLRFRGAHWACSASMVSPAGLVMTNSHCLEGEPPEGGFYAKTQDDEVPISMVLDQLVEIEEWMSLEKTGGRCGPVDDEVVMTALLSCFDRGDSDLCRWVERLSGESCQYYLYKYRRFYDVRLVFVPEYSITMPRGSVSRINLDGVQPERYGLDVAFVRVYWDGVPLSTEHYLSFSKTRVKEGDLVFASGNPGEASSNPNQCFLQGYDPPDSSPRLSYGLVQGYFNGLNFYAMSFSLGDVLEKAPQKSHSLPAHWHRARKTLNLDVLYGLSVSVPVAGGSSGSPLLNKNAEVIGLVARAEGQDVCSYDEGYRTYGITSEVIVELLGKVYGADRMVEELVPHAPPAQSSSHVLR